MQRLPDRVARRMAANARPSSGGTAPDPTLPVSPIVLMSRRILSKTSLDVLSCLRRQGSPYRLSPGNLLKATMVTSGTMTNRIDRLEESGLVRRSPDPDDKRGVRVSLTDKGLERVDDALADLLSRERGMLSCLTDRSNTNSLPCFAAFSH